MRIRKNTTLSPMLFATAGYGGEKPETYVCHFNQSPWDVIPDTCSGECDGAAEFTNLLDSSWFLPSPSSLIHLFDGEDSFNGNVSLGDSNGASERLNSFTENNLSLVSVERLNLITSADNYERSPDVEETMDLSRSSDKKTKAIKLDSQVKTSDEKVAVTMPAPPKRGRPRGTAKKTPVSTAASNNPYEFYYYSGFGPRWGRKRGGSVSGSGDEKVTMEDNEKSCENDRSKKSCSSDEEDEEDDKTAAFGGGSSSFDEFYYVEEENYELVEEESDHGKKKKNKKETTKKMKRCRKPVKERSLKSLM